jgi:hypothetical protein
MLRSSLGAGIVLLTGACGTGDSDVFTGAVADGPTSTDAPTTSSTSTTAQPNDAETSSTETTAADQTTDTDAPAETAQPAPAAALAVAGELIVSFTYTRGAGGKIEWPYVAVWVEDGNGELVETIALFYEQGRRGARWLDHLDRWFAVDADRVAAGGTDDAATISSATRAPGTYDVAWDGTTAGVAAGAGEYFICIESAREDGPYSLIREPVTLAGALPETPLPDDGELSAATVRIDA